MQAANPKQRSSKEVLHFVDMLLEQRGVKDRGLSAPVLEQMRHDLYDRVDAFMREYILQVLTEEQRLALLEVQKTGNDEEIQNFLLRALPNIEQIVSEAMMQFQTQYLQA